MKISKNFSLWEFFVNEKPESLKENGEKYAERIKTKLVDTILQPMRNDIKLPITITSGFRCPEHNTKVKGKSASHHLYLHDTCACDITCSDMDAVWQWLEEHDMTFCYCYLQKVRNFIHISGLTERNTTVGKMWIDINGVEFD